MPLQEKPVQGAMDHCVRQSGTDDAAFRGESQAVKHPDDMPLPFPVDPQQIELLQEVRSAGGAIASEGTERYELFSHLVESGHLNKHHCPKAQGVYQFLLTSHGRDFLSEEQAD